MVRSFGIPPSKVTVRQRELNLSILSASTVSREFMLPASPLWLWRLPYVGPVEL